jgi:hypothetical protein
MLMKKTDWKYREKHTERETQSTRMLKNMEAGMSKQRWREW